MKLAKLNNQSSEYKNLRGKVIFQIQGTEEQAELIERLDVAIGSEIKCLGLKDGEWIDLTWEQECSDNCADYVWGSGCGWIMDQDDVEEFKALWKKHKKLVK